MRVFVTIGEGTGKESRISIRERLVIGRDCAGVPLEQRLVVDDPEVSRQHVEIRLADGAPHAVDISANGTLLNGSRIERGVPVPLQPGDLVEVGKVGLRIDVRDAPFNGPRPIDSTLRRVSSGPTVMVVGDIIGFSAIAERSDSLDLTESLETLFGGLRSLLREHGGMLANYAGDAFFAAWELRSSPDGSERALDFVRAAAAYVDQIAPTLTVAGAGGEPLRMGWGVALGDAAVSVLTGALTTVVGDAANVAFRLAGIAGRGERSQVLVLEAFAETVAGRPQEISEQIEVKGRSGPVSVLPLWPA